jgi:hypothetical protein
MVMLGWVVLNCWIADCWKGSWNVDPLALSVPLSALDDEPPPAELDDELQAARSKALTARAAPAVTALW